MARLPRLTLADHPHQVIQRGHNGQPIFIDRDDRERLLFLMADSATRFGVAIHAYVLLDNAFHLLATPSGPDGMSQFMQAVGRGYVRYFNDRHGRSGTLWDGRYRSTLIQADRYLLPCMVSIDLRPVRAGLVEEAGAFAWSSHGHYAGSRNDRLVTPHALYWALGNTPFAREAGYADLVHAGVSAADEAALDEATLRGWAAGDEQFLESLQKATERRVVKSRAGRPSSANSAFQKAA
ncbi:transposase [Variovorax sp. PAMC 28711]|uniref:transposase n=1 Tax=Variovorax sp. PAMC 28711 TaxID=1795631 RepID=UPI00078BD43F|nr:transposase [Variovorax sp. PAMC 28711]AMM23874.1 transposase [Variovorax sp. PAMC 28711]